MKLPVVNDRGSVSRTPVIGKKIFHRGLFEKIKFENFDFQNQKYLAPKNIWRTFNRCKIEFWTTFVFCTKLIFQLLFELQSFEKVTFWGLISLKNYFLKILKLHNSKGSWKINLVQKTSGPEFNFTSYNVQIIFRAQIFFILKITIFNLNFLKKLLVKNFNSSIKYYDFLIYLDLQSL